MRPGRRVRVAAGPRGVDVWVEGAPHTSFERDVADHVFVRVA
jgi:hypothetical protein